MEKIVGPINGFYVAAYATTSDDSLRYTSYAKIYRNKPCSYWEAVCLFKFFGGENHATVAAALAMATLVARGHIDNLPSLECSSFGLDLLSVYRVPAVAS
jgi:hypothetical protein